MAIITLHEVSLSFGGPPLLDRIDLRIETGERIALLGRNGEGKSTLLKLLAGEIPPDNGRIVRQPGFKAAMLDQQVPDDLTGTIFDVVAHGLGELYDLLARYHDISRRLAAAADDALLTALEEIQHEMETVGGWQAEQRVEAVLSRLGLEPDTPFASLSGGLKRRVLLARALVVEPDLLLLDEPTNHLDIESIEWLEAFLPVSGHTLVFVTHDRMLADKIATRILDLDRGQLTSWAGNYREYLRRKEALLANEAGQQEQFDKKLSEEEAWIRQGVKARRTRNQGRVRALQAMREERRARREVLGQARMRLQEADLSGRLVVQAKNIGFGYGDSRVIDDFSTTILRGDKVGIIGPNGCGKTTLLNILLGRLAPQQGTIRQGTNLQPAYFDQLRAQLDETKSVAWNVADGKDTVIINGRPKHIIGYMKDFLFTPDRARSPVSILSGGERNRLLLARLFSRPANILVLDEPTNDLDMDTLELLEELLLDYQGTLLLVSHDRAFLNNVVTGSLVFEGQGLIREYAGGYDDWLRQRQQPATDTTPPATGRKEKPRLKAAGPRKPSFKEKRELEELPGRIEALEAEQKQLYATLADPAFYQESGDRTARIKKRLHEVEQEMEAAYARWEELVLE